MSGNKKKQKVRTWRKEEKQSRVLGFTLIGAGGLGLLFALLFSGIPGLVSVPARFSKFWTRTTAGLVRWVKGSEKEPSPWDLSRVKPLKDLKAVPSAKGWSALDSFYATHPPVEGEAEYYLDPALWREPGKPKATGSSTVDLQGGPGGETASAPSRRSLGVWTGPADGVQMVDTSIQPVHEQLKRQGAMSVLSVPVADSVAGGLAAHGLKPAGGFMAAGDSVTGRVVEDGPVANAPAGADGAALAQTPDASGDSATGTAGQASLTTAQVSETPSLSQASSVSTVEEPTSQKSLHVEFWESPVHYKGYQLNGNNLILYGINESDSLRFENHTDGVWMYHKAAVYRLTRSTELQRFELISGYEEEVGSPMAEEIAE